MMSEYKAETASYPTQTSEPAKALASTRSLAYSVVDGDGNRAGKRVWLDGSRRSESHRSDGLEAPRTGRTDPDRDEARARRRKERERHRGFEDADDRLPPVVDDEVDSVDGDDFMSRGGPTPAPGPRDPNGGNTRPRGECGADTQDWLSSCSFIPGLHYCAMAPPAARGGRDDDVG